MTLAHQFAAYSDWRNQLAALVSETRNWLGKHELADTQTDLRLAQLLERLREDRLSVAFVAEFSRGKSELINAIFFADYGNRMLPSSAGRTTMCPTELMFDADKAPCIELLPIQTRATHAGVAEYKRNPEAWTALALDVNSAEAMQTVLRQVSETLRVTSDEAADLGFAVGNSELDTYRIGDDGLVEVPRWRHALINFPHPLLQQGLVILDTPGLNAIGAEPELTLSLLPNAHAVLFILAADTGVTQSDLTMWTEHIGDGGANKRGRLVVLNKIDSQWDELKTPAEVDREIERQASDCARILGLPMSQVFPVSAQKGLVAKINGEDALLERSRLPLLESALSQQLIPSKQAIVGDNTRDELTQIDAQIRGLLNARLSGFKEQLGELGNLRGKNKGMVEYMMGKVKGEKEEFEAGLQRYYAVRSVFTSLSGKLFAELSLDTQREQLLQARTQMQSASFSKQLSEAMAAFFTESRQRLQQANQQIDEILTMMGSVYKKFSVEHGLKLGAPTAFSLHRHDKDVQQLEAWCATHLTSAVSLLTHDKKNITQRFFEEVAVQIRHAFEQANKDAETWLRALMAPMETQIREHHTQLKRRLESIKRIHEATDSLEERIAELRNNENTLAGQIAVLDAFDHRLNELLAR